LFTTRFFAVLAARLAAFPVFFFFEDFLATAKILVVGSNRTVGMADGTLTASLPRASRTPRKPVVFAQDYSLGCHARRGRSFPTPPPAAQGGAGSHWWRHRRAAARTSSDRRCR